MTNFHNNTKGKSRLHYVILSNSIRQLQLACPFRNPNQTDCQWQFLNMWCFLSRSFCPLGGGKRIKRFTLWNFAYFTALIFICCTYKLFYCNYKFTDIQIFMVVKIKTVLFWTEVCPEDWDSWFLLIVSNHLQKWTDSTQVRRVYTALWREFGEGAYSEACASLFGYLPTAGQIT